MEQNELMEEKEDEFLEYESHVPPPPPPTATLSMACFCWIQEKTFFLMTSVAINLEK